MIVGDRVRDFVTRREATVIGVQDDAVRLEWDDAQGQETFWYSMHYFTASGAGHPLIEVIPSEPVTAPAETSYRDAAIERLAYNVGTMEYELFSVWQRLNRVVLANLPYDPVPSMNALADIIESIEECAGRLKPKTMPDGTVQTPYLAAQINANRK